MAKQKVLLLNSPFSGIGKNIGDLVKTYREDAEFLSLKYTGDIPQPNSPDYTGNLYDPNHFYVSNESSKEKQKEVISRRLSDVIGPLIWREYRFKKTEEGLVLIAEGFNSDYYRKRQPAIEKIAELIYDVNVILPVWSKNKGGQSYKIDMDRMYKFFDSIVKQKPSLFLSRNPVEVQTPLLVMTEYLKQKR